MSNAVWGAGFRAGVQHSIKVGQKAAGLKGAAVGAVVGVVVAGAATALFFVFGKKKR